MKQLHGILWSKGTLLTPQHLQVQDRYLQDLLHFKTSALLFRPWGFQRLEVDREALAAGTLSLSSASGLFPDGLAFDAPDADPLPPPLGLDDVWRDPDLDSVTVSLTIPEYRPGAANVTTNGRDREARFFSEVLVRRDENTGKAEKPIQVARKNLRLLEGGEGAEAGSTLPVARIVRSPAGEFELDPDFVPPLLDFTASDRLGSLARRLIEVLAARSAGLARSRRERGAGLADFGVSDVANFWLLYTVNSHLPRFRHLFEARKGHPGHLYQAMLELAGALSTFSSDVRPGDLPSYDHADLGGCFRALDEAIHRLLATVVPQRHVSLPLQEMENAVHATALHEDRYLTATQLYVAVRYPGDQATLIRRFPQLVKVGSGDRVEQLIKQALPGVPLRHVANPPEAVPVKLDRTYFQLEARGEEWEAVRRARNLAAYVPSDFPEVELELVLLLPREREG